MLASGVQQSELVIYIYLHVYIYPLFSRFFSHTGCYRVLSGLPFFQILSLLINMKAPHLHPPPFHPEILRDACLGFIQLAAHCLQLRFDPGFLEACNTNLKVSPPPHVKYR